MILKTPFFVKKLIFYISDYMIWFKFCQHVVQIRIKERMEQRRI